MLPGHCEPDILLTYPLILSLLLPLHKGEVLGLHQLLVNYLFLIEKEESLKTDLFAILYFRKHMEHRR